MKRSGSFWRNATIVAIIHVVVLAGLARWSGSAKPPPLTDVVWLQPGDAPSSEASLIAESQTEEEATPPPMEDPLTMRTPPPAEIDKSTPTPKPSSTPRATPKPTPKKARATPSSNRERSTKATKLTAARGDNKKLASNESSPTNRSGGNSAVVNAELVSYAKLLHDRFDQEWMQPTGLPLGAHYSLSVHLRIERDGRIAEFKLARSSGNVVVDESVEAAGQRVTQVEPLPAELATAGAYELNVNFEVDAK